MNQDFFSKQRMLGLFYGLATGLAFAIMCWGIDAISLTRANASFPWIKFIPGLILSLVAGGLVGWLTARTESHLLAIMLWLGLGALYSWLTLWLQFNITPFLLRFFNPSLINILKYPSVNQVQYWLVGFFTLGLASLICGLLEINLIKNALFSSSGISLVTPFLIPLVVFSVSGTVMDYTINTSFRTPVVVLNELIDFAYDNKDTEVPTKIAREKHLATVKGFVDLMESKRDLTVITYNENLGQMDVLVNFSGTWVRCTVIFNQPVFCKRISTIPGIIDGNQLTRPLRFPRVWGDPIEVNLQGSATSVIQNKELIH